MFLILLIFFLVPSSYSEKLARREMAIEQVPFAAFIKFINQHKPNGKDNFGNHYAAGITISSNTILTRAYFCEVGHSNTFMVKVGATFPMAMDNQKFQGINEYHIHPHRIEKFNCSTRDQNKNFDPKEYRHVLTRDFCVLQLSDHFNYNERQQPAPLPAPNEGLATLLLMTVGWGPFWIPGTLQAKKAVDREGRHNLIFAQLFYHVAGLTKPPECLEYVQNTAQISSLPDDVTCIRGTFYDQRTGQGDDGGPVFHWETGKVVAMNCINEKIDEHNRGEQLICQISTSVDWIYSMKKKWARDN